MIIVDDRVGESLSIGEILRVFNQISVIRLESH
jgi:hypothetical protein